MVLRALDAFYQEHRRCGELDGGVEAAARDALRRAEGGSG